MIIESNYIAANSVLPYSFHFNLPILAGRISLFYVSHFLFAYIRK